jgi:hypothetical protein
MYPEMTDEQIRHVVEHLPAERRSMAA